LFRKKKDQTLEMKDMEQQQPWNKGLANGTQTDNNTLFLKPTGLCHIMVTKTHNSGIPSNNNTNNNNNNNSSRSGSILFIPYTQPTQSKWLILLLAIGS